MDDTCGRAAALAAPLPCQLEGQQGVVVEGFEGVLGQARRRDEVGLGRPAARPPPVDTFLFLLNRSWSQEASTW